MNRERLLGSYVLVDLAFALLPPLGPKPALIGGDGQCARNSMTPSARQVTPSFQQRHAITDMAVVADECQ